MARVWYDAAGAILRLAANDAEEAEFAARSPLAGAAGSLAFDEATNATLVADLGADWNAYACPAGVLKKGGVNVTINADGAAKAEIDDLLSQAAGAISANNTYIALASPTNAQTAAQVKALSQQINRVIRRLVRLNRLVG